MDFKARFAGKTSKISKEGVIDEKPAEFDEKNQMTPNRNNSISKKDRISINSSTNN